MCRFNGACLDCPSFGFCFKFLIEESKSKSVGDVTIAFSYASMNAVLRILSDNVGIDCLAVVNDDSALIICP